MINHQPGGLMGVGTNSGGFIDLTPTANGVRPHYEQKIKDHNSLPARTVRAGNHVQKTSDATDNVNNAQALANDLASGNTDAAQVTGHAAGTLKGHVKGAGAVAGVAQIVHGFNTVTDAFKDHDGKPLDPDTRRKMIVQGLSEGVQGLGELVPGKRGQMLQAIGQNMMEIDTILANPKLSDTEKAAQVAVVTGKVIASSVVGVVGGDVIAVAEVIKEDYQKGQLGPGTALRAAEATSIGQGIKSIATSGAQIKEAVQETDSINKELAGQYKDTNIDQAKIDKQKAENPDAKPDLRSYKTLASASMMIHGPERREHSDNYQGVPKGYDPEFLREKLTKLRDEAATEAQKHERPEMFKSGLFGYVEHQSQIDKRMYDTALKELDKYEENHKEYFNHRKQDPKTAHTQTQEQEQKPANKAEELAKSDQVKEATKPLEQHQVKQQDVASHQGHNASNHKGPQERTASAGRTT